MPSASLKSRLNKCQRSFKFSCFPISFHFCFVSIHWLLSSAFACFIATNCVMRYTTCVAHTQVSVSHQQCIFHFFCKICDGVVYLGRKYLRIGTSQSINILILLSYLSQQFTSFIITRKHFICCRYNSVILQIFVVFVYYSNISTFDDGSFCILLCTYIQLLVFNFQCGQQCVSLL